MFLVQADDAQARERDRATYAAWGGPLAVERYQEMEARIRDHPWSRAVSTLWLLRSDQGEVLSSCETYRMPSVLRDGSPASGHAYAVASVFTDPDRRRQGCARELLDRLGRALAEADPGAQAMILFSDVPPATYGKCGFTARPALELVLDSVPGDPRDGVDELLTEAAAARAPEGMPPGPGRFVVAPAGDQVDWHLERERIYAEVLGRPRPSAWGARAGAGTALWTADYRYGQLALLACHAPDPAQAEALVASARRTAFAAGLPRTVLWRTPETPPWIQARVQDRVPRLDSVPMIRPLDGRVRPEDWAWIPRILWV
ncbi:MAG: GNAT family N-acetyltransferase [Holophaga sp.]|jgi:GNAT superfamily N-acetyltransferase